MREWLLDLAYIIFGIFLALAVNQALALALSTDMPVVAVESNSMVPTFYKGDLLVLIGTPPEELKPGDIIVFSPDPGSTPIVHRVIYINPDGTFQTKGDANPHQLPFEKSVRPESIHGKVIAIIPFLGWVKILFTELVLPNLFWIALIIILGYSLNWGWRRWKHAVLS